MPLSFSIRLVKVCGRHPEWGFLGEDVESFLERFEERRGFGGGGSEEVEGVRDSAFDVSRGWRESKEVEGDRVKVGESGKEERESKRDGGEESLDEMPNVERSGGLERMCGNVSKAKGRLRRAKMRRLRGKRRDGPLRHAAEQKQEQIEASSDTVGRYE